MKVFELLREDIESLSEQQIIERLRAFDWRYEFSSNQYRIQRGERELEILENLIYRIWKSKPEKAIQIWNQHSPGSKGGSTPSFIFRLQAQDKQ